jgi:hypothetical protein
MRISISFLKKAIVSLAVLIITVNIFSLFIINNLNISIINSLLYNYSLRFDWSWATVYWTCLDLIFVSALSCISLAVLSAVLVNFIAKTKDDGPRAFSSLTLAFCVCASIFSLILFFFIDNIVNNTLYDFELQFNLSWYEPYFLQGRFFLATQILSLTLAMISFVLVFFKRRAVTKINSQKIVCLFLLVLGAILLGFSLSYDLSAESFSIPSFVGLGLIFWGVIIGYVSTEDYAKREVLEATNLSYLTNLNEILDNLQIGVKAVFLPSKYLGDSKTNKIYMAKSQDEELFNLEAIRQKTIKDNGSESTLMVAPGNELVRLFEKILGRSFSSVDFSFFEINMPKLIVTELELAQSVEIIADWNIVKVKMKNLISFDLSKEIKNYMKTVNSVGTPLSSAIACALANCTGKPVVIKNHRISLDEKAIEIDYIVIKEKGLRRE